MDIDLANSGLHESLFGRPFLYKLQNCCLLTPGALAQGSVLLNVAIMF